MRVLAISSIFPSTAQPHRGTFVRNRLGAIAQGCELRVLCPIPWFPFAHYLKRYRYRAHVPAAAQIGELSVDYPRFLSVPGVLKPLDGFFLLVALWWWTRTRGRAFAFDLIDAHFAYPEGFAGALLANLTRRPLIITVRGSDLNLFPRHPVRRLQVRFALRSANRVIAVAEVLRRTAVSLGCPEDKALVIPNGVDANFFYPTDRRAERKQLGLPPDSNLILTVGNFVERKGFHILVEALAELRNKGRDARLIIIGEPADAADHRPVVAKLISDLSLAPYVFLPGPQPNEKLRHWYNAADLFCLASSSEGRANVLLESLACGTPVIATDVGGNRELVPDSSHGLLVERMPHSVARAIDLALSRSWNRDMLAAHARGYTWEHTGRVVLDTFHEVLRKPQA